MIDLNLYVQVIRNDEDKINVPTQKLTKEYFTHIGVHHRNKIPKRTGYITQPPFAQRISGIHETKIRRHPRTYPTTLYGWSFITLSYDCQQKENIK